MEMLHQRRARSRNWRVRGLMPLHLARSLVLVSTTLAMVVAFASAPSVAAATAPSTGPGSTLVVGAVYIATNGWNGGNEILTFPRYANGSLGRVSTPVATGGSGSGPGQFAPIVDDPLGSQNSLITDDTGRYLFAVNAGSGSVSSLAIGRRGLTLVDQQPSVPVGVFGQPNPFPVSLAESGNTLYVLNAIGNSLTGFKVSASGRLAALQNCALPPLPVGNPLNVFPATALSSQQTVDTQTAGQVGFSPDGRWLVVTSKEGPISTTTPPGQSGDLFPFGPTSGSGHIYAYRVTAGGGLNCASPAATALPVFPDGHGTFPFSFAWSNQGRLLVTEVFGESDQPASLPSGLSAVSSFTLNADGTFTLQRKVPDPLPVPCWIVRSGNNVFVANFLGPDFGLGAISSYKVALDGGLVDPSPASAPTTGLNGGSDPIDMAVSNNGQFLYQLAPGPNLAGAPTMQVYPFVVGFNGSLTALTPVNDGQGGATDGADAGEAGIATVSF